MEAEELFLGKFQAEGYRNSEGLTPTGSRDYFGQKEGFYHWDIEFETLKDGKSWLKQHSPDNPHGATPHLQIEPVKGPRLYIFWPR
ncbi:hypothetical protein [Edaphocola flava]|uniref:hypothetical protein n=1 Tax=Edaphocola flava TaxID=2499629 RepID=UPI00100B4FFB|nr:hypothetical protein [Edaphocola flava]